MKHPLFTLLLISSLAGMGQIPKAPKSTWSKQINRLLTMDSLVNDNLGLPGPKIVPAMFLASDTSEHYSVSTWIKIDSCKGQGLPCSGREIHDTIRWWKDDRIFWMNGYLLKQLIKSSSLNNPFLGYQWETTEYLDERKKPFHDGIYIWEAREMDGPALDLYGRAYNAYGWDLRDYEHAVGIDTVDHLKGKGYWHWWIENGDTLGGNWVDTGVFTRPIPLLNWMQDRILDTPHWVMADGSRVALGMSPPTARFDNFKGWASDSGYRQMYAPVDPAVKYDPKIYTVYGDKVFWVERNGVPIERGSTVRHIDPNGKPVDYGDSIVFKGNFILLDDSSTRDTSTFVSYNVEAYKGCCHRWVVGPNGKPVVYGDSVNAELNYHYKSGRHHAWGRVHWLEDSLEKVLPCVEVICIDDDSMGDRNSYRIVPDGVDQQTEEQAQSVIYRGSITTDSLVKDLFKGVPSVHDSFRDDLLQKQLEKEKERAIENMWAFGLCSLGLVIILFSILRLNRKAKQTENQP